MEKIETFELWPVDGRFVVDDTDSFNSWGRAEFATLQAAREYATWAHAFKGGRTMSGFIDWLGRNK